MEKLRCSVISRHPILAQNDLKQATILAFAGMYSWGLGDGNLLSINQDRLHALDPSSKLGKVLNTKLMDAEKEAVRLINTHRDMLTKVAQELVDRRELRQGELKGVLRLG